MMSFHMMPRHHVGWRYYALLAAAIVLMASGTAYAKPKVERLSFSSRADGMGFVVRIHTTGALAAYSEPRRVEDDVLELILFNTELSRSYHHLEPRGPVLAYSEQVRGGHLVLRFRLDPLSPVDAAAYRDRATNDLLIGLSYLNERPATLPSPVRAVAVSPARVEVPEQPPAARPPAKSEGERWKLDTVVIDAGHGGRDPGASANGVREKDVVLSVALKLGEYIRENLGLKVIYTRSDDQFIELRERGRIANQSGGKLFISIHANSASDKRAHGTETFFLGMHKTDTARRVMERENEVVKYESNPDHYKDMTEQALIRQVLTQSAYMRKSQELATFVETQFGDRVGRKSRGVKQAGLIVLWGASMPAVLVELGFLTNPDEAAFLKSESGQAYMASAIFRAVRDYKAEYEKGLSLLSTQ